jgi:hypothetical protein
MEDIRLPLAVHRCLIQIKNWLVEKRITTCLLISIQLFKGCGIEANTPLKICAWICGGVAAKSPEIAQECTKPTAPHSFANCHSSTTFATDFKIQNSNLQILWLTT